MTSDAEIIKERVAHDDRKFLINALDHTKAPRIAPAANAIRSLLADGEWHTIEAVIAEGVRSSDLSVKTIDNLLRRAKNVGIVERSGEFKRAWGGRSASDTRKFRLVSWPTEIAEEK